MLLLLLLLTALLLLYYCFTAALLLLYYCFTTAVWRSCPVLDVNDRKIQVDIEGEKHRWMEIRDPRGLRVD